MTHESSSSPVTGEIALHTGVTDGLLAQALETVSEGSLITDAARNTIYANSAFTNITGYGAQEILGTNCRFLQGADTSAEEIQRIRDALDTGSIFQGTILNYRKDGSAFWNHLTITPLHDAAGIVTNFVSVQRDVSDIMEERERLSYKASHDALTKLPNREGSRRLLRRSLSAATERGDVAAIGLLDLDLFKQINDEHGHPAGDEVLVEFSKRVSKALRRGDHVTRAGGDEFVVILSDLDPAHFSEQLRDVLHRLRAAIVPSMTLSNGAEISLTASMGIALFPLDGVDPRSLFDSADRALYRAKTRRGTDSWWETVTALEPATGSEDPLVSSSELPIDVPGVAAHHVVGELTMYMQPIVDLVSGCVTQLEALARIRRPDGSILLPDQFLLSYTVEQLREVFWIGLDRALEWIARWQIEGRELSVSLNVPPEMFALPDSAQLVVDALNRAGVDPSRLSLELLENRELELKASDEAINELVRLGVRLHLDDISSGYSTLKRVTELPFDVIKIDRHIFDSVHTRALHVITVMAAIIRLGADFGYGVTIEGIENQERLEVSFALGARYGQGYHFARPMPPEEVQEWIENFQLPTVPGAITTALGALTYHWSHTRTDELLHPPRDQCSLTDYFSGENQTAAELHEQLHQGGRTAAEAGTLLTSWLLDEVRGRH